MGGEDHCSAYQCSNRRSKRPDLSFHAFPSDPAVRAKWVQAVRRAEFVVTQGKCLCSEHFTSDCFYPAVPDACRAPSAKKPCRRLKPGSFPTIFSFRPPPLTRPSHGDRLSQGRVRAAAMEEEVRRREAAKAASETEEQKELRMAKARVKELECQVATLRAEVSKLSSQLFRFENIKENSAQLEFLSGLTREIWDAVWDFLQVSMDERISYFRTVS